MAKKYFSAALLLFFLFNIGGYYFWFKIEQYQMQKNLKNEIRKGLRDEELSLIIKPNKEFIYQGEMYDVVRIKVRGDEIHYYCINDQKEKQLIATFNKNHDSKNELEKKIKNSSIAKYFPQQSSFTMEEFSSSFAYGIIEINYKLGSISPPSPPPKFA